MRQDRKLEAAARVAWLYYVAGNTQDEIAAKLNISRQAVQRLVALAVAEKLIKFRLDHPIAACMALATELAAAYALQYCAVAPIDPAVDGPGVGVPIAAADYLLTWLALREPLVLAFSTGRTLRAMAEETPSMLCPQHRLVSLVGSISRDGRASSFEVVRRLADRTGAQCFPMPTPVIAGSVAERELLQTQRSFAVIEGLAASAAVALVGIGNVAREAPLHRELFVTDDEIDELVAQGAIGEIAGWAFDRDGQLVAASANARNAGVPLTCLDRTRLVGVAGGQQKIEAIAAALSGRLLGGLITDERTAAALLEAKRA